MKKNTTSIETYAGTLEFQGQTITQETAQELHRQIDLQRASQLALWAMPIVSIYQLYDAYMENLAELGADPNVPSVGSFKGYYGVYLFLTANVTTPYTVSMLDLSILGPVVVEIPAGELYGVASPSPWVTSIGTWIFSQAFSISILSLCLIISS